MMEEIMDLANVGSPEELEDFSVEVLKIYCRIKELDDSGSDRTIRARVWDNIEEELEEEDESDDSEYAESDEEEEVEEVPEPEPEPVVVKVKSKKPKSVSDKPERGGERAERETVIIG